MWRITASGLTNDISFADAVVGFLREKGFKVLVKDVDADPEAIDLAQYFRQKQNDESSAWQEQRFVLLQSATFTTLGDLTKLTFEEFWQASQSWGWGWRSVLRKECLELMIAYNVQFADVDPVELRVEDLNPDELGARTYNCLTRDGISSLAMLRCLSAPTLMDIRNFGGSCLDDVRAMLRVHDVTLKG